MPPIKQTIDLRSLPPSEREAQLNNAVAVASGWRWQNLIGTVEVPGHWINPAEQISDPLPYTKSSDAIMPLLEKHVRFAYSFYLHEGTLVTRDGVIGPIFGRTFPVAACLCVLRAHGIEVLL